MKKTFIVLFDVGHTFDARPLAESIENENFEVDNLSALSVREQIIKRLELDEEDHEHVGVYPLTDFMDEFNDQRIDDESYFMGYVTGNLKDLVPVLMDIRKDWTEVDFKEAYGDEWDDMPVNLSDCFDRMRDHIHHTYDIDYIKECIENEKPKPVDVNDETRWMHDYILIHVARTWERVRMTQPHQEMPQDNIESAEDSIPSIAYTIFNNDIIQGFLTASEDVKQDDYWSKNTGTMSDCYIEQVAEDIIKKDYLN